MSYSFMIVDDSLPMRAVIIKTIKAAGYKASVFLQAENGETALNKIRSQPVDIVITDYNMPGMDGLGLIQAMKSDSGLSHIPVLVITTEGSQQMVSEFMKQGAAGYIKKPFTPESIREKINQIMGAADHEDLFETGDDDFDF